MLWEHGYHLDYTGTDWQNQVNDSWMLASVSNYQSSGIDTIQNSRLAPSKEHKEKVRMSPMVLVDMGSSSVYILLLLVNE